MAPDSVNHLMWCFYLDKKESHRMEYFLPKTISSSRSHWVALGVVGFILYNITRLTVIGSVLK